MSDLFSRYINSEGINFKHSKGASDRSGKEFHLFHEIILFINGDAELISETVHTKLKPYTLIVIPKETYHQVVINGEQNEYCRCVFQFEETYSNKAFIQSCVSKLFVTKCDEYTLLLFKKMMLLAKNENQEFASIITESILTLLLDEIKYGPKFNIESEHSDLLTNKAIEFISKNLTNNLNIESIANELNVSPSTLMHTFKTNMNISIHKYVIKKRLLLAHTQISQGVPSYVASIECGFNDYSGFYRQYKKMFDISPSKSKQFK